jgi:hypothetical protein
MTTSRDIGAADLNLDDCANAGQNTFHLVVLTGQFAKPVLDKRRLPVLVSLPRAAV